MNKYYVLDTNVLLYFPQAIFAFNEHSVFIPNVQEELDRFNSESTERGAHSRQVSRIIDELRTQGNRLADVPLNDQGGILRIETNCLDASLPCYWDRANADNRILHENAVQLKYRNRNPFGVLPRNIGQVFVQECLMIGADEAPLVIIKGNCFLVTASNLSRESYYKNTA